jgi:hypothetical protein
LCDACTKPSLPGRFRCHLHTSSAYYRRNRKLGRCTYCTNPPVPGQTRCPKHIAQGNAYNLRRRAAIKLAVLTHYSRGVPQCFCCGERNIKFLTLDHVNNDGAADRKAGKREWFYFRVYKTRPDGLRILCFNCNSGRSGNKGVCPHEEQPGFVQAGFSPAPG